MTNGHEQHEHRDDLERRIQELSDEVRRGRRRLKIVAGGLLAVTLAMGVAPAAASHLTVRSSDIVNGAVKTPDLHNNAVKPAKIDGGAVTNPKIRSRAVGDEKLKRYVPGVALAGADVDGGNGSLFNWFNRFGGKPTVTRTAVGRYEVVFPGLAGRLGPDVIVSATLFSEPGSILQGNAGANNVLIRTYDSSGTLADRSFDVAVLAPGDADSTSASTQATRD